MATANRVLRSIETDDGGRCVGLFARPDGTFGFEEYRRDPEDMSGWFPLHRYSHHVFATAEDALAQAKSSAAWMGLDDG